MKIHGNKKDSPKTAFINIRLEPELLARIKAKAQANGLTLSQLAYQALSSQV